MLRAAKVPAGPINGIDEAFALAEELGMEPVADVDGVPLISPPLRIDGERPPIRHRPPASTSTATTCARGSDRLDVGDELAGVQQGVDEQRRRLVRPAPCRWR